MVRATRIEGVEKVISALKLSEKKYGNLDAEVQVGYTVSYSLFVHENKEANHTNGQAKFLEQPARELKSELIQTVKLALKAGKTLEDGLYLAGLRIQREAQKLTPVDTGALKASAFTARLKDVSLAAHSAFAKAVAKKASGSKKK